MQKILITIILFFLSVSTSFSTLIWIDGVPMDHLGDWVGAGTFRPGVDPTPGPGADFTQSLDPIMMENIDDSDPPKLWKYEYYDTLNGYNWWVAYYLIVTYYLCVEETNLFNSTCASGESTWDCVAKNGECIETCEEKTASFFLTCLTIGSSYDCETDIGDCLPFGVADEYPDLNYSDLDIYTYNELTGELEVNGVALDPASTITTDEAQLNNTANISDNLDVQTENLKAATIISTTAITNSINNQIESNTYNTTNITDALTVINESLQQPTDFDTTGIEARLDSLIEQTSAPSTAIIDNIETELNIDLDNILNDAEIRLNNQLQSLADSPPISESLMDTFPTKITSLFTPGTCEDLVFIIPNAPLGNNIMTITCEFSDKIKLIFAFLVAIFTIIDLINLCYMGLVPKGTTPTPLIGGS